MPDETQNPGADAPAGDAAAPTTDDAVGEAAVGADVGEDEFNPPNAIIYRTPSGEEEVHVYSETGQDDAIIKPSGEIVRKDGGALWDEVIEAKDVVEPIDDPATNAVYEGVETPPTFMMEDTFEGGGLGEVGEEDVVEPMDEPVVDP